MLRKKIKICVRRFREESCGLETIKNSKEEILCAKYVKIDVYTFCMIKIELQEFCRETLPSIEVYLLKQPPEVSKKKGVRKYVSKFTEKQLCQSLFFNMQPSAQNLLSH